MTMLSLHGWQIFPSDGMILASNPWLRDVMHNGIINPESADLERPPCLSEGNGGRGQIGPQDVLQIIESAQPKIRK